MKRRANWKKETAYLDSLDFHSKIYISRIEGEKLFTAASKNSRSYESRRRKGNGELATHHEKQQQQQSLKKKSRMYYVRCIPWFQ